MSSLEEDVERTDSQPFELERQGVEDYLDDLLDVHRDWRLAKEELLGDEPDEDELDDYSEL